MAAPALSVAWFIAPLYVELPVFDQWELVDLFDKLAAREAHLGDFTLWVNRTHRMVFPRIVFAALAFATNWTIKVELYVNLLLAALGLFAVAHLARLQSRGQAPGVVLAGNLASAFVVFSFAQWWNWLWGFAIAIFMVNTCICVALLAVASGDATHVRWRLSLGAALCFVASFCMAHGLLAWWALLPTVVSLGRRASRMKAVVGAWLGLALLTWGLFFWGGTPGWGTSSVLKTIFSNPLPFAGYYFALLGNPWAYNLLVYPNAKLGVLAVPGLAATVLFAALAFRAILRRGSDHREQALPWISLGLFALLYAGANLLGRPAATAVQGPVGHGILYTYFSMYSTPTSLMVLAVLQLGALAVRCEWTRARRLSLSAGRLVGLALMLTLVANLAVGAFLALTWSSRLRVFPEPRVERLCMGFRQYLTKPSACFRRQARPSNLGKRGAKLEALDRLGFRPAHRGLRFTEADSGGAGVLLTATESGSGTRNATYTFEGTVSAPLGAQEGAAVLLTYAGERRFFAVTLPRAQGSAPGAVLEWSVRVRTPVLPPGRSVVWAWLFDPKGNRVVKLDGQLEVVRKGKPGKARDRAREP
jgi:hypothetical protein